MSVARELKTLPARAGSQAWNIASRTRRDGYDAAAPLLKEVVGRVRSRHLFALDILGFAAGSIVALSLWLNEFPNLATIGPYLWVVGIVVATRAAANILLGLYSYSWRYASVADMGRIIVCTVTGSAASAAIVLVAFAFQPPGVSSVPAPAFWFNEMFLALAVMAVSRFAIRIASDVRVRDGSVSAVEKQRTLLFGAGWAGVIMARSAIRDRNSGVDPVGFLDGDLDLRGRRVSGLRVFGDLDSLPQAMRKTKATALLITMPSASGDSIREVASVAMAIGLQVRTVPPVTDLLDGSLDVSRIRSLRVEDLLRRPLAKDHTPAVRDVFEGKTVVITGAAGSIGSELVRQVTSVNPARIVLVDQAESPLYLIEREAEERLEDRRSHGSTVTTEISVQLADVTSRSAMDRLFAEMRPDVVLHAAAYKHVPMLEIHASEAVRTNIGGTMAVVDAAAAAGVKRFVLVSTDKAVWPSSVMGATKRVAEMIVADAGQRLGRPYISVRFGNVLGSSGSVVPIFQGQLEQGRPLTITDPAMTRYFMTIPEAAWLILDAAALARRDGVFVLDMGEPVKIIDIARDLIRLAGRDADSVPINVIGLRKGEKLHEELFYDQERVYPTEVPKVLRSESPQTPLQVRENALRLTALADGERDDELRAALHAYVRASVDAEEGQWGDHDRGDGTTKPDPKEARELVAIAVHGNGNGVAHPSNGNGVVRPAPSPGTESQPSSTAVAQRDD